MGQGMLKLSSWKISIWPFASVCDLDLQIGTWGLTPLSRTLTLVPKYARVSLHVTVMVQTNFNLIYNWDLDSWDRGCVWHSLWWRLTVMTKYMPDCHDKLQFNLWPPTVALTFEIGTLGLRTKHLFIEVNIHATYRLDWSILKHASNHAHTPKVSIMSHRQRDRHRLNGHTLTNRQTQINQTTDWLVNCLSCVEILNGLTELADIAVCYYQMTCFIPPLPVIWKVKNDTVLGCMRRTNDRFSVTPICISTQRLTWSKKTACLSVTKCPVKLDTCSTG